ncbi:CTA8 [Candida margitis]|uniref:CTA8 n=1 Tax=Candida margitis TaxID=1775924 RepID=UPI00222803EF|nr:CTA8 [Candida margitis]KAI5967572.1 CTA8 [Candida margitis]
MTNYPLFQPDHMHPQQQQPQQPQSSHYAELPQSLTPLLNAQSLYDFDEPQVKIEELKNSPSQASQKSPRDLPVQSQHDQLNQLQQTTPQRTFPNSSGQSPLFLTEEPNENQVPEDAEHTGHDLQVFNRNQMDFEDATFPELKPLTMPVNSPLRFDFGDPLLSELKFQPPTQPAKKRKESGGPKTRPAFVMKIWSMVNDKSNDEYIRWNDDGKTFQVFKREDFVHKILPAYFKHQNMSSFVRQLNMYGFHKVQDITNGTLYPNGDKSGGDEVWQFENPNFIRGREDLLDNIVRNKSVPQEESQQLTDTHTVANGDLGLILSELSQIKQNQARLNEEILRIRQDNQNMYSANYINRERTQQQGRTINKILKFLAAVYNDSTIKGQASSAENGQYGDIPFRRRRQTEDDQGPTYQSPSSTSSEQQRASDAPTGQFTRKPRLLLTNRPSSIRSYSTPDTIESIKRRQSSTSNVNRLHQELMNGADADKGILENGPDIDQLENQIRSSDQSIEQVQDWIEKLAQQEQQQQQRIPPQLLQNTNGEAHVGPTPQLAGYPENDDDDQFNVDDFLRSANTPGSVSSPMPPLAGVNGGGGGSSFNGNSYDHILQSPQLQHVQLSQDTQQQSQSNGKKRTIQEIYDN